MIGFILELIRKKMFGTEKKCSGVYLNPFHADIFMYYTPSQFFSCKQLQHLSCKHVFPIRVENNMDLMASSETRRSGSTVF